MDKVLFVAAVAVGLAGAELLRYTVDVTRKYVMSKK